MNQGELFLFTFILVMQAILSIGLMSLFVMMGRLAYTDIRRRLHIQEVRENNPAQEPTGVFRRTEIPNSGGKFRIERVKGGDDGVIADNHQDLQDWIYGRPSTPTGERKQVTK